MPPAEQPPLNFGAPGPSSRENPNTTTWFENYSDNGAPPAYTAQDRNNADPSLTAAFDNLQLPTNPVNPEVDTCLAHLKLLFAFQWMKEDVGFTDGLWGLWDDLAGPIDPVLKRRPEKKPEKGAGNDGEAAAPEPSVEEKMRNKNLEILSEIREKRWALFVARAVDRYEAWWQAMAAMTGASPLKERDMTPDSFAYTLFPFNIDGTVRWDENMLPPLDVLMVWHTHMLNPRAFLEDCIRAGMGSFWGTGLPWHVVDKAIDTHFNYNVSAECKRRWSDDTGRAWDNAQDPMDKTIPCPRCSTAVKIPWTRFVEGYQDGPSDRSGSGYGDGKLRYRCRVCDIVIRKELLAVHKFIRDYHDLTAAPKSERRPMPGTLLDPKTGIPTTESTTGAKSKSDLPALTFPNRILNTWSIFGSFQCPRLNTYYDHAGPTMHDVRKALEEVLAIGKHIKKVDGVESSGRYVLPSVSRIAVRKMMSRYWENFSPFALDLGGAVMRQGVFGEKMCKLDWLHSPSAQNTMARLLTKYDRFLQIMAKNPKNITVPTLDVDLAWHTHQLSPSCYYNHTVDLAGRFIDHDDKIADHTLSKQFEWTSKVYQAWFGEVYSECTCWYCESIRASHSSSLGKVLGMSKHDKIAESFHATGAAALHPPSTGAHISAHPAVQPHPEQPQSSVAYLTQRLAEAHNRQLGLAYARARARAEKKGRPPPRRDDEVYYDHWGFPYLYTAPYAYPLWWTPGLYYGWYPGYVVACAAGVAAGDVVVLMREGPASVEDVQVEVEVEMEVEVVTVAVVVVVVVSAASFALRAQAFGYALARGVGVWILGCRSAWSCAAQTNSLAGATEAPVELGAAIFRRHLHDTAPSMLTPISDSEQPWLAQFQSRPILKEPEPSFHRTFADITPESSVYIPASSVGVPLIESPNVSVNSSWASNLDRPFSIGRYVSNHERHETILLSLSAAPRRPIPPIPDVSNTLPPSNKPGTEERLGPFEIESAEKGIPNDSSLHRYLTDIQPHELLSVALEQKSHHPSERKAQRPHQDSQKTDASISLSATLSGGEQLEQVDVIPSPTEVMRRSYVFPLPSPVPAPLLTLPSPAAKSNNSGPPGIHGCTK
ncbi:uncharacterized protein B0H64DRAFT_351109 [Chaetomium fimeti]|uniref:Uncharacterized protein n=1 Tax=Chaetomium fimeti TaxID=1854472 RepID=A0AAE0HND4_9PEZI|nr:hypothetical protein B0H64DRAFT_351109 [Chaetomium fimeti]